MIKEFIIRVEFNQHLASEVHFEELKKEVKETLNFMPIQKGAATAQVLSVEEK